MRVIRGAQNPPPAGEQPGIAIGCVLLVGVFMLAVIVTVLAMLALRLAP